MSGNSLDPNQTPYSVASDLGLHCVHKLVSPNTNMFLWQPIRNLYQIQVCLFVLRFYGPVNPMESCQAQSVYLTTRLLGRLSPLSG